MKREQIPVRLDPARADYLRKIAALAGVSLQQLLLNFIKEGIVKLERKHGKPVSKSFDL